MGRTARLSSACEHSHKRSPSCLCNYWGREPRPCRYGFMSAEAGECRGGVVTPTRLRSSILQESCSWDLWEPKMVHWGHVSVGPHACTEAFGEQRGLGSLCRPAQGSASARVLLAEVPHLSP